MLSHKYLTIDIGSDMIYITEVTKIKDKVIIQNAIKLPTPKNSVEDGFIKNIDSIAHNIKIALEENNIKTRKVVFTISSSKIITREVTIPYVSEKKVALLVKMNASEYFPVNIDDYIIDYTLIEVIEEEQGKNQRILVIAAPHNILLGYADIAKILEFEIKSIDYSGNSTLQLLKKQGIKGANIYINLGDESSTVTILNNKNLELQRYIPFGINGIYDAVKKHYEIEYDDALEMIKNKSFLSMESKNDLYFTGDITSSINQILGNISRLMDYYTSRYSNKIIDNIYIIGSGANILGIEEYISQFLGIKSVQIMKNFNNVDVPKNKKFYNEQILYSNCIGSAFSKINILPDEIANIVNEKKKKLQIIRTIGLVCLILASILLIPGQQIIRYSVERSFLNSKIKKAESILMLVEEHTQVHNQLYEFDNVMKQSSNKSELFLNILNDMEKIVPSEVTFLSFNNTQGELALKVIAKDKLTVAKFIEQVKKMKYFSNIYVPSITNLKEDSLGKEKIQFPVICTYK